MTTPSRHGRVVAFEGSSDSSVCTQLRLLPVSPQILILPSIENYLIPSDPRDRDPARFHAPTFVRSIHDAAAARMTAALSFLNEGTPDAKRLVFLNGGTPSAYALCIRAIAENETSGDVARAEDRLRTLVADGLANNLATAAAAAETTTTTRTPGLARRPRSCSYSRRQSRAATSCASLESFFIHDPITTAMRAADALDRQTESLQPSTVLDLTPAASARRPRPRSMSLPIYGFLDTLGDSAPFFVFGARSDRLMSGDESVRDSTVVHENQTTTNRDDDDDDNGDCAGRTFFLQSPRLAITSFYDEPDDTDGLDSCLASPISHRPSSCLGEVYRRSIYSAMTHDEEDTVVFGEASILRMSSSPSRSRRGSLRRATSLDRASTGTRSGARLLELSLRLSSTTTQINHWFEDLDDIKRFSNPNVGSDKAASASPSSASPSYGGSGGLPTSSAFVVRPATATPILVKHPRKPSRRPRTSSSYVDRGTDAEVATATEAAPAFEPVLPFTEDLVVYFKNGCPDSVLDRVIQSLKRNTAYGKQQPPVVANVQPDERTLASALPVVTPTKQETSARTVRESPSAQTTTTTTTDNDEYDPFSYQNQPSWMSTSRLTMSTTITTKTTISSPWRATTPVRPPTRAPPTLPADSAAGASPEQPSSSSSRIHEFDVTGSPTALAVQNGLRSLLSQRFPAAENGFRQFSFHPLPELDGFWRPIFPGADRDTRPRQDVAGGGSSSMGSAGAGRIVDQIIAFGAQAGVPREFVSSVGRRLERLGAQPNGVSYSSRLDFRYLVANAMQAFTAQPLAKQTDENPFANPYLLATLVIPHLETYLAAHCEVRLLVLEYPSEHLATVLAMQRLLGLDLMKVAQIIAEDHPASGNRLFGPLRGPRSQESSRSATPTKWPSTHYYGVSSSSSRSAENLTPATANYLLTSRATEAEVSTFLSTISAILAAISPLYADSYYYAGLHQHEQSRRLDSAGSAGPSSMGSPAMSPPPSGATFSAIPHLTVSSQSPLLSPASLPHYGTSFQNPPSPAESPLQTPRSQRGGRLSPTGSTTTATTTTTTTTNTTGGRRSPSIYRSAKHLPLEPEDEGVGLDIDDGSDYEDLEEKRLMPIFMRRSTARKSDSHKALKFLGLA